MDNQNQQAQKKKGNGLNGIVDTVVKFLPFVAIAFLVLGVFGACYYWIEGLVSAIDYESFKVFTGGLVSGISCFARYLFYTVVTLGVNKLIRK